QKPPLKTIIIDPGHGGHGGGAQGILNRKAVLALQISLKVRDLLKQQMPDLDVLMTRERDVLPGNLSNKNEALKWRADYANRNSGDLFISIHLNATAGNQRYGRRVIGEEEKTYYVYTGKGKNKKKIAKTKKVPVYERYRLPATVRGTQTYILARDWYNQKVRSVGKSAAVIEGGEKDTLSSELLNIDPVVARIRATQYTKYFFQKSFNLATYLEEEFARVGRYSWGVQQRDWDGLWVLQATEMPSILIETGFIDNPAEEQYLASEAGQMETAQCVVNAIKRYRETLETNTRAMNALPAQASVQQPDGNTAQ
ncbi:MAG TPA: N-acetylmuramoyl-L-alanine amidase, partial [Phnomibacter sp.]|nr:N-acetylmuramoyl-L-alanine amidase [Phnomibacter sp.]